MVHEETTTVTEGKHRNMNIQTDGTVPDIGKDTNTSSVWGASPRRNVLQAKQQQRQQPTTNALGNVVAAWGCTVLDACEHACEAQSEMKCVVTFIVLCVDVCAEAQQLLHELEMTPLCSNMERRHSYGITHVRVSHTHRLASRWTAKRWRVSNNACTRVASVHTHTHAHTHTPTYIRPRTCGGMGGVDGVVPVSYTHLTLPTIYSV